MASKWHQKKSKQAEFEFEKALQTAPDETAVPLERLLGDVAMGGGETQVFEKKLTKEEKRAQAKAKREAKRKAKKGDDDDTNDGDDDTNTNTNTNTNNHSVNPKAAVKALAAAKETLHGGGAGGGDDNGELGTTDMVDDGIDHEQADALAAAGTICTFSASRKGVDARSRDINVQNFTLQHMGAVLLDETQIVLNHGNRYGLIGRNGCGKSTLLAALGARAIPIPKSIDIFFLKEEVEPSDTMTALEAVMSVEDERLKLEQQAEELNHMLALVAENPQPVQSEDGQIEKTADEIQEEIMDVLNGVYERLDALDAATAEVRARSILAGLGFTHEMQSKLTKDFSGGWRMRVSLARALLIQPMWYVSTVLWIYGNPSSVLFWWLFFFFVLSLSPLFTPFSSLFLFPFFPY